MKKYSKQIIGSYTAKAGFKNEKEIAVKFNNWKIDKDARKWLSIMSYSIKEIDNHLPFGNCNADRSFISSPSKIKKSKV